MEHSRELIARDAGSPLRIQRHNPFEVFVSHLEQLMETDAKATGLKDLQGLIWRDGFLSGMLTSHVYPDVAPALAAWTAAGRESPHLFVGKCRRAAIVHGRILSPET